MKTIWKYPLQVLDRQTLFMPPGAEILSLQTQFGNPCLWARVAIVPPRKRKEDA